MRYDSKSGITVMLVDTNEKFLQHFHSLLSSKLPYNFIFEKDGTRALLKADKTPVHLFLMETKLTQKVSGFKTLELIRSDEQLSKTPVIFVSSMRDVDSVSKARVLGASDYLHKPIIPDKIFSRTVKFIMQYVKFKVLLVDGDEKIFSRTEEMILKSFPYQVEVVTANSVPAGMEILDTQEINLLICGNNMPVISGVRMLSMLRDRKNFGELAVVFVPEELSAEDRFTLSELDVENFLEKPFRQDELIKTMMAALNLPPVPFVA